MVVKGFIILSEYNGSTMNRVSCILTKNYTRRLIMNELIQMFFGSAFLAGDWISRAWQQW